MRWRIPLLLTLVGILAVSCDQQLAEPAAEDVATVSAPAFNFLNNPDNANPRIYRSETDWVYCWSDEESTGKEGNGLRVCHGTQPLGDGTETGCGLQEGGDPIEFQLVGYNEDFEGLIHRLDKGAVFVTIRDTNTPGDCFGDALVAEGWGRMMYVDNNLTASDEGGAMNAFKVIANGHKLATPDGGYANYNGHQQVRFFFEAGEVLVVSERVNVQ